MSNTSKTMCVCVCIHIPEAVQFQVIGIKVEQGLLGITWPLGLQHRRARGDDRGLA